MGCGRVLGGPRGRGGGELGTEEEARGGRGMKRADIHWDGTDEEALFSEDGINDEFRSEEATRSRGDSCTESVKRRW